MHAKHETNHIKSQQTILNTDSNTEGRTDGCNCRIKEACPVNHKCQTSSLIYHHDRVALAVVQDYHSSVNDTIVSYHYGRNANSSVHCETPQKCSDPDICFYKFILDNGTQERLSDLCQSQTPSCSECKKNVQSSKLFKCYKDPINIKVSKFYNCPTIMYLLIDFTKTKHQNHL